MVKTLTVSRTSNGSSSPSVSGTGDIGPALGEAGRLFGFVVEPAGNSAVAGVTGSEAGGVGLILLSVGTLAVDRDGVMVFASRGSSFAGEVPMMALEGGGDEACCEGCTCKGRDWITR
jgi:hypothetical protein